MQVAGCRADVLGGDSAGWVGRVVEDFALLSLYRCPLTIPVWHFHAGWDVMIRLQGCGSWLGAAHSSSAPGLDGTSIACSCSAARGTISSARSWVDASTT